MYQFNGSKESIKLFPNPISMHYLLNIYINKNIKVDEWIDFSLTSHEMGYNHSFLYLQIISTKIQKNWTFNKLLKKEINDLNSYFQANSDLLKL